MNSKTDKLKIEDILHSFTIYTASESGIFDKLSPEEAGIYGSMITDCQEALKKLKEGKITQQEFEEEIKSASITVSIAKFIDEGIDKIMDFIEAKTIAKYKLIATQAKEIVKKFKPVIIRNILKPIKKVIKTGLKLFNKVKEKITSFFS